MHPRPAAVLIEVLDQIEAGRAALSRLRKAPALAEVPMLAAVTVPALQRVAPEDPFHDIVLVPYVPVELYVRIRRAEWRASEFSDGETLKVGPLVVDCAAHEVKVEGRDVTLTHQEYALLEFLARDDALFGELGRVLVHDALHLADLAIHERLREHGLVDFVVTAATVRHQIHDNVL